MFFEPRVVKSEINHVGHWSPVKHMVDLDSNSNLIIENQGSTYITRAADDEVEVGLPIMWSITSRRCHHYRIEMKGMQRNRL